MKLGVKGQKALSIAKKGVVIAGAVGAIAGIGHKAENKYENVKAEVESEIDKKKDEAQAAKVVAGAVANIGVAGVKDAAANPLKAKKALDKSKKMAELPPQVKWIYKEQQHRQTLPPHQRLSPPTLQRERL